MVRFAMSMWIVSPSCTAAIGPPTCGFRRDVPHAESTRGSAEPAIGEKRDAIGKPRADDRASDAQHLAHSRPSARAFVANHDDIAGVNLSA